MYYLPFFVFRKVECLCCMLFDRVKSQYVEEYAKHWRNVASLGKDHARGANKVRTSPSPSLPSILFCRRLDHLTSYDCRSPTCAEAPLKCARFSRGSRNRATPLFLADFRAIARRIYVLLNQAGSLWGAWKQATRRRLLHGAKADGEGG